VVARVIARGYFNAFGPIVFERPKTRPQHCILGRPFDFDSCIYIYSLTPDEGSVDGGWLGGRVWGWRDVIGDEIGDGRG
jgi:hypothetical protein